MGLLVTLQGLGLFGFGACLLVLLFSAHRKLDRMNRKVEELRASLERGHVSKDQVGEDADAAAVREALDAFIRLADEFDRAPIEPRRYVTTSRAAGLSN